MDNNKFEEEQSKVKNALFDADTSDKLIPFIGAGFSKNIRDYPDWNEFVDELGNDISIDLSEHFGKNVLEATEFYIWEKGMESEDKSEKENEDENERIFRNGKRELLKFISKIVKNNPRSSYNNSDWICHDKLVKRFDYMYTTNWDNTLELSDVDNITPIYLKSDLVVKDAIKNSRNKYNNNREKKDKRHVKIIKFHGHYDNPDAKSLVACQKDFNVRILEENPFDIKFKHDLLHFHFFFIGYRFGDPNISLMIQEISQLMGHISEKAKTSIFWISAENFGDPRVEMIKRSLGVKVYHLLNIKQQKDLDNCKIWNDAFKSKKQEYLKEGTETFLDIFREE